MKIFKSKITTSRIKYLWIKFRSTVNILNHNKRQYIVNNVGNNNNNTMKLNFQ